MEYLVIFGKLIAFIAAWVAGIFLREWAYKKAGYRARNRIRIRK